MTNHPITELEQVIDRAYYAPVGFLEDSGDHKDYATQDDYRIAALTALCREYAASELRLLAGSDEDMANYYGDEPYSQIKGEIDGRNELRRTLRVRASELDNLTENE